MSINNETYGNLITEDSGDPKVILSERFNFKTRIS
jgi:hypothetical protein